MASTRDQTIFRRRSHRSSCQHLAYPSFSSVG